MRGSRNFCQRGGGGWGGGPGLTARKQSGLRFLLFFSPQPFLQFTEGSNGFIAEKTILSQGSREDPTFSRGSNYFQGVQMLIFIETHITCDFPGEVRTPYAPHTLDPHMTNHRSKKISQKSRVKMLISKSHLSVSTPYPFGIFPDCTRQYTYETADFFKIISCIQ